MGLSGTRRKVDKEELCFVTQYCAGDRIEKKGMGGACSAYGEGEEFEGV